MSFSVRGQSNLNGLQRLVQEFRRGVLGGGNAAVAIVVRRAQEGIRSGPHSGRVYTTYFRTGRNGGVFPVGTRPAHQASAPGEYSANDTGDLANSISGTNSLFQMRIFATSPHAAFQEDGTSRMQPRPNIKNAVRDTLPEVRQVLTNYVWRRIS